MLAEMNPASMRRIDSTILQKSLFAQQTQLFGNLFHNALNEVESLEKIFESFFDSQAYLSSLFTAGIVYQNIHLLSFTAREKKEGNNELLTQQFSIGHTPLKYLFYRRFLSELKVEQGLQQASHSSYEHPTVLVCPESCFDRNSRQFQINNFSIAYIDIQAKKTKRNYPFFPPLTASLTSAKHSSIKLNSSINSGINVLETEGAAQLREFDNSLEPIGEIVERISQIIEQT